MPMLQLPIQKPQCHTAAQRPVLQQQQLVCPVVQRQQRRQQQCRCSAADNAAAPSADAPQVQMEEQPSQLNVPTPLGPTEPPQEEPKKLPANARLSESLAPTSTSITIIGDDTELNWAVCQALSKKIGWFPVSTAKILLGMHKAGSIQEIADSQGWEAVVRAEAGALRGLKDQLRVCVATIGDGAAADAGLYSSLYGSIIIWLDEVDKRHAKPATAARAVYQEQSEVRAQLQCAKGGFGARELSADDKAQKAASEVIKAMNKLLKEHDYLPQKKRLYVEYGCRGDWPDLQPKEWHPVLEGLQREPLPTDDA